MSRRIHSLDTLRGLAALIVLANHLQHSFLPSLFGTLAAESPGRLIMAPVAFLLNGSCAVSLFFVLSGFVLSERFLASSNLASLPDAVVRRWPRLAGPALMVNLLSGLLMGWGLYANTSVADHNGAWWLKGLYNWRPAGLQDLFASAREGAVTTFLSGACSYNGPLWTMHFELLGSMVVYVLSAFLVLGGKVMGGRLLLSLLGLIYLRECFRFPFMACFILGVILAYVHTRFNRIVWKNTPLLITGLILSILVGGMTLQENDLPDCIMKGLGIVSPSSSTALHYFLYSCVAVYFLGTSLWCPAFSSFLSKPSLRHLGRLSFPIYLLHTPVICFLGCRVYLMLSPFSHLLATSAAIIVSMIVTFMVSIPLASFDDAWISMIRHLRVSQWSARR